MVYGDKHRDRLVESLIRDGEREGGLLPFVSSWTMCAVLKSEKAFDKIDLKKALSILKKDLLKIQRDNGLDESDGLRAYEIYEEFIHF